MVNLEWKTLGASVQGASHLKNGKPCQDSILYEKINKSIIIAIADGHGSNRSPYSDEGSKIAVEIATEIFKQMYKDLDLNNNLSNLKHFSEEQLKKIIVRRWREQVEKAYKERGTNEEDNENFYIKYGSTLISILATPEFVFFLQLGDGDIIVVFEDGEVSYAIEKDENLIGTETTSLCNKDAWKYINTNLYKINAGKNSIKLIMLSTDGYYNSFATDEGYKKTAKDYLSLILEHGSQKVEGNLENWLSEISKEGCGDDISLGVIFNES